MVAAGAAGGGLGAILRRHRNSAKWRTVATRYEKTARSFLGVLCMAATRDRLEAAKG